MTWARFDDKFHSHPKALRVGLAGCGLFLRAVTYCCDHLTDGHVPEEWVATQLGPNDHAVPDRLLDAGLWREAPGGFQILDFLDFNPSRADVEAKREKARAAGRAGAKKKWANRDAADSAESMAERQAVASPVVGRSLGSLNAPNRTGTGTGLSEQQKRFVEKIESVRAIFLRFGFDVDEASVLNALERGKGLDHEDIARKCAEWCRTHDRPPAATLHTFIDNELRRRGEDQKRDEHKPLASKMVPMRPDCRDCGVDLKVDEAGRCRPCRRKLDERNAGAAA